MSFQESTMTKNLDYSSAISILNSEDPFPVDFDDAWKWLGYSRKNDAKQNLLSNFEQGLDYLNKGTKKSSGGRPSEHIALSVDCFKSLGMMAGTDKGKEVRRYFLQCEQVVKRQIPQLEAQLTAKPALNPDDGAGIAELAQRYGFGRGKLANDRCREWIRMYIPDSEWLIKPGTVDTKRLPRHLVQQLDDRIALSKQGPYVSAFIESLDSVGKNVVRATASGLSYCPYLKKVIVLTPSVDWALLLEDSIQTSLPFTVNVVY
jgi:phage anti-repressor protein